MKIRLLSVAVTTGAILALLTVFWFQSDTLFGARLKELHQLESNSLRSFVKTLLDSKQYTLQSHRRRWEKDPALAKALLFEETANVLPQIRAEENFDLVQVVKSSSAATSLAVELRENEPWMISRSPVRLFDETVGQLILGYRLNGEIAKEIADATKSSVRFTRAENEATPDLVYASFPLSFNAQMSGLQSTTQSLRGSMLWVGSLCLLLIALLVFVQRKLEARSRTEAVGRIAAQVAHDLRSPLAALEIAVESENSQKLVRMTVDRIRKIIRDLDEKKRPATHRVELAPLAKSIVEEKKSQYRANEGLAIRSELSPDLSASLDPVEFQRIVSNLIDNSVQALPRGGNVQVCLTHEGSAARLRIKDDGIGIPDVVLPRLFRRGASFGKKNGNGLGLWHARKMAERWGGRLDLKTQVDHGTEVSLEVPLA